MSKLFSVLIVLALFVCALPQAYAADCKISASDVVASPGELVN